MKDMKEAENENIQSIPEKVPERENGGGKIQKENIWDNFRIGYG